MEGLEFAWNRSLFWDVGRELPNRDDGGGGPAGVNDGIDDGGNPAGVLDTLEAKLFEVLPKPLEYLERESGVEGGLDEKGTAKPDIFIIQFPSF